MTDKTVLEEVHGTIIGMYECPTTEKQICIQPDDETRGEILTDVTEEEFSQFSVGQRVVNVSYT